MESFGYVGGQSHLGVVVMQLTRDLRTYFGAPPDRGVLVAHVEPRSAASRAGVRTGDVIVDVANRPVSAADDVIAALGENQGRRIRLSVIRGGQLESLTAKLPGQQREQQHDEDTSPML